jgi:hypothetical protein
MLVRVVDVLRYQLLAHPFGGAHSQPLLVSGRVDGARCFTLR